MSRVRDLRSPPTLNIIAVMKIVLLALVLASATVKGVVEISPSGIAPVCQVGDQLELTCSVTGRFLRWQFTVNLEHGSPMTIMLAISSGGSSGVPPPVMINSTSFIFSRLSTQPLTSTMTINPVSEGLNEVQVNCEDVEVSQSATTTIQIVDATDIQISSIQSHSAQLMSERITVILEWTVLLSQIDYQQLLQNASINVVPDPGMIMIYTGNRTLQLTLAYNTLYNVSITQPGICGQPSKTTFIELKYMYRKCSNPVALVNNNVRIIGYEDPALEGESIIFTCPSGSSLSGPNSSMCMGNEEWEPDPRDVVCIHELITTGTTTKIPDPSPSTATVMLRITLISMTCVFVMMSALVFIIGFVCGHCFSQRWRKLADKNDESPLDLTNEPGEDLELKENVAYITIRPK